MKPQKKFEGRAYTIEEFCAAFKMSRRFYQKMRTQGIAPREMRMGGKILISLEAADAWRKAREGEQRGTDVAAN